MASSSSSSSLKKYKKIKYLGKGSYGAAILVELRSNPAQKFVVKEIVIGHLKPPEQAAAKKEAEVLHQMNHSNITLYIESFVEASKLYIVMEHADGGDLTAAVGKRRESGTRWGEDEVMRIFVQICLALKHVHGANILHRDLKSQNVFLTSKGIVKLGDFGIAKVLDSTEDQARTQIGTPYYLSPEICESKPYGRKSDIWSLGVILYELLALEMPFQAQSLPALVHRICTTEPSYTKLTAAYSAPVVELLRAMLDKDPDQRPGIAEVVRMDVIRKHISKLLSYTLKAGEGGAAAAAAAAAHAPAAAGRQLLQSPAPRADAKGAAPAGAPAAAHDLSTDVDAEEADRKIERARRMQAECERDSEARDAAARRAAEREAQRAEEREKLRKFRQDMLQRRRDHGGGGAASAADNDDVDSVVGGGWAHDADRPPRLLPRDGGGGGGGNDATVDLGKAGAAADLRARRLSSDDHAQPHGHGPGHPLPYAAAAGLPSARGDAVGGGGSNVKSLAAVQAERMRAGFREAGPGLAPNPFGRGNYQVHGHQQPPSQQQQHHHQQQPGALVPVDRDAAGAYRQRQGEYESAARREFFANRAMAQAVKAKVEALERGGDPASTPANHYQQQHQQQQPHQRASPTIHEGDAEARIAFLKAQRERDRDRSIAEQEAQLKAAYAAQREERRRLEARVKQQDGAPMAFEISFADGAAKPSMQPLGSERNGSDKADPRSPPRKGKDAADADEVTPPRQRKGWGPPLAALPTRAPSNAASDAPQAPPLTSSVAEEVEEVLTQREYEKLLKERDPQVADDEARVRRRLDAQRDHQHEARARAKEVFRKLREKREQQAKRGGGGGGGAASPSKHGRGLRTSASSVEVGNGGANRASAAGLQDVLQGVARAQEAVDKAVASAAVAAAAKNHGPKGPPKAEDKRGAAGGDDEIDDDLRETIDSWLNHVGGRGGWLKNASARRLEDKGAKDSDPDEIEIEEEEESKRHVYQGTAPLQGRASAAAEAKHDRAREVDDEDEGAEADDAVAELQCMLAQELLADPADDR